MIKRLIKLIALVFISSTHISAQAHHDNVWLASVLNGALQIDFSTGVPEVRTIDMPITMEGGSAAISDENGDLQFYTNGCAVYNFEHELMENGDTINPGEIYEDFCNLPVGEQRGYPNGPQSTVIIPSPDHPNQYLLFHKAMDWNREPDRTELTSSNRTYVTIVDMSENDGRGRVVNKNLLIDDTSIEPGLMLNKHANGKDWWLLSPLRDTNSFAVFLVDSAGVTHVRDQQIGNTDTQQSRGGDQGVFTPQGDKYLRWSSISGLQMFDFNRESGELSNFLFIELPFGDRAEGSWGGVGVSPSGQFAYVSTIFTVYQYDLWADDIGHSRETVAHIGNPDSLWVGVAPTSFNFQLGPDCKLYNYTNTGYEHHVIHYPDEKGYRCEFEQGGLDLPFNVFRDQPYFPNYRLGPLGDEGSPCAKIIVSNDREPEERGEYLNVYPNPARDQVNLSLSGLTTGHNAALWSLYDGQGRLVEESRLTDGTTTSMTIDKLPSGMYFWRLTSAGRNLERGKMVVE